MMEMIGQAIAWLVGEVFMVWFIGGFVKFIHSVGVRIYSLFAGTSNLSTAELRIKYDDKALPWFLGFLVFGAILYGCIAWMVC
jgi:hypothetical protein